ncbi:MAG: TonB family protein [Chloracidobacterium sp.]|nr:TonB family protein [Chloracidobacterium sp.]
MGKIVKFCSSCDEGFAEKFGFCPNCGQGLTAFEMNPVIAAVEPLAPTFIEPAAETVELPQEMAPTEVVEPLLVDPATEVIEEPTIEAAAIETAPVETLEPEVFKPEVETVIVQKPVIVQTAPVDIDRQPISLSDAHSQAQSDGQYYLTVIEEKDTGTRNSLLMGASALMIVALFSGLVYGIFSKDLDVGSIGDETYLASLIDAVPMAIEEEKQQQQKDSGGGGGGGGREEEETTLGDLANQTKDPVRPPQAIPRLENPSLILPPASTQGNRTFEQKYDRFGDPNGRFSNWSNGPGTGGGQGTGAGTGQGSGRGTGTGSGDGSGSGGGLGDGNGDGFGPGGGGPPPPPSRPVGVTQGIKILSKPRPGYTDSARQANIQGTVILRVTFLGSGGIGSISTVKGLPNGLTEQAIAAARRISFDPAKRDGIGQTVTKQIEYTFSIY